MNGGSGAASPDGPSGDWRNIYDRVEAMLPRVEALAADRARLEALNMVLVQRDLSGARENSLHARLLQAEASRTRWKTAYIELPLLANPKIIELQENDLEDSRNCHAFFDVDNLGPKMQLKEARRHVELSENNVDYEDVARDLRLELRELKKSYETLSSNKDKEAAEAAQKLQHNIEELQVAAGKKDDEIGRLRAEAFVAEKKESSQECSKDIVEMDLEEYTLKRIFVEIRDGKTIALEVKGSDTIFSVKAKIQEKEGLPACQQRLVKGNELLVGSCSLDHYHIQKESTLTLHLVRQGMHIIVKTLTGMIVTFEVERADTAYSLKLKIFDEIGHLPVEQRLVFASKWLEDDRTLADHNIQNDSLVHLVLNLSFPKPPEWNRIHIEVRTPTGRTVIDCFAMSSEETVGRLKRKIHVELCIPLEQQRLSWRVGGEPLEDDCVLAKPTDAYRYFTLVLQPRLPVVSEMDPGG